MKIILCGDIALCGSVAATITEGNGEIVGQDLREKLQSADIFIANIECPLTDSEQPHWSYFPTLKGPRSAAGFLSDIGVTIGSVANNHIADYGLRGLMDTVSALQEENIITVGAGKTPSEAEKPVIINRQGMAIAIVALAQPEIAAAKFGRWGAGILDEKKLIWQIESLKKETDIIIAYLHFGVEWFNYPTPCQILLCRAAIDAGAKLVIGHHPHVPQGFEYYRDGFIAYSLGNFIFDMPADPKKFSRLGLIIEADFDKGSLVSVNIIPVDTQNGNPRQLDNEENIAAINYLADLSMVLKNEKELIRHYYRTCRDNFKIHRTAFMYYSIGKMNMRRLNNLILSQFWPQIFKLRTDLLRFLISGEAWAIEKEEAATPSGLSATFWLWLCRLARIVGFGWGRILKKT